MIAGIALWGLLHTGMTREEVRAAVPSHTLNIAPGCVAVLDFTFERGQLASVDMTGGVLESEACRDLAIEALRERYGVPDARHYIEPGTYRLMTALTWQNGGGEVRFQSADRDTLWHVFYRRSTTIELTPDAVGKF